MNKDDQKEINNRLKTKYTPDSQLVVNGSGVDLSLLLSAFAKEGNQLFVHRRLIKSKGIVEFYNAAIKTDFLTVTFTIVGDIERNADVISNDWVVTLKNSQDVLFIGSQTMLGHICATVIFSFCRLTEKVCLVLF